MDFVKTVMLYYASAYESILAALFYDRRGLVLKGAFMALYYEPTRIFSFETTPLGQVQGHIGNEKKT